MVEEMKVRKGYKNTEVGVIPEDWEVVRLDEVSDIMMGQSPSSKFYNNNQLGLPLVQGNADIKNRKTIKRIYTTEVTKKCNKDDLIMTLRAPVGKIAKASYDSCLGRGVCAIKGGQDYLYHFLISMEERWTSISKGSTFDSINSEDVYNLKITIPLLEEQKAIAKALTDTDNLIHSIENLIDKKEKIKQGTMQELLTGKKRLDGFSGEWEVKKLVEIGDIVTGNTPPTSDSDNYGGDFLFVGPGDLGINKYIKTTEKKLSNKGSALARIYPVNSILVTCIGSTIGKIGVAYEELSSNQQINAVIPNNTYSSDFMYYALGNISHKIRAAASEQAVPIINKSTFGLIEILVPKLEEQKAIAQILSDMDQEIQGLKEKLEKYKTIKQGMMQELLTGRIRLI